MALGCCAFGGACAGGDPHGEGRGAEIMVAPLTLPGADDVCYGIYIQNGSGDLVVALNHVCSSQYGNGAGGDISYVAPCDASAGDDLNTVTLVLEGIDIQPGAGTSWEDEAEYVNPCGWDTAAALPLSNPSTTPADTASPGAPNDDPTVNFDGFTCQRSFTCKENEDVAVPFNLTVMRDADQGFFDIAVNFEDVFCSAKIDSCYDVAEEDFIDLLFDDQGARVPTAVMAAACSAGLDDANTVMWMSAVDVSCTGPNGPVSFSIDPSDDDADAAIDGVPGNHCVDVALGTDPETDAPLTAEVCYALYWGQEDLRCQPGNVPCNKEYWTLAVNLDDLDDADLSDCAISAAVTASSTSDVSPPPFVEGQLPGPGQSYGYIQFDADLTGAGGAPECFKGPMGSALAEVLYGTTPDLSPSNEFPQLCYSLTQGTSAPVALDYPACGGSQAFSLGCPSGDDVVCPL